jgi:hypothetical protein
MDFFSDNARGFQRARIKPHVQSSYTIRIDSKTPHEVFIVTLRYLATGRTIDARCQWFISLSHNEIYSLEQFGFTIF